MEFKKVVKDRYSCKKYSSRVVEAEKLNAILEAGRLAPTAKNNQPQKIYVLNSKDAIEKINDASPCIYGAQTVLLVCSDKTKAFAKEDYSTYEMDACIVATHMMLEATNVGVDNIWIELFDKNKVKEYFNIKEEPICLIPLGYRTDDCPVNPNHTNRKELSETVTYL